MNVHRYRERGRTQNGRSESFSLERNCDPGSVLEWYSERHWLTVIYVFRNSKLLLFVFLTSSKSISIWAEDLNSMGVD